MLNIEALDKVIAMVVVLLALSLFVQALQGWLKKIFKIKSLQIEQSLVHLYHYVLNKNSLETLNRRMDHIPLLRHFLGGDHPADRNPQVKALYNGVMIEFKKVGRLTGRGKLMLDSISRGDLLKFMGRMPVAGIIAELFPDSGRKFTEMRTHVATLLNLLNQIKTQYKEVVSGPEFKKIEKVLTPLLTDVDKFLSGASDDSGVIMDDIAKLREINPEEVRQLLEDLPGRIDVIKEQVEASEADDAAKKEAIKALDGMEKAAIKLSGGIDNIIAGFKHIRDLKTSIETWYDTVMQSFEERYTRSMRTWTIIISACVVIIMNANIINIYRDISTSQAKRAIFLQAAEKYGAAAAASNAGTSGAATAAAQGSAPAPTPSPASAAPDDTVTPEEFYREGRKIMATNISDLTAIGLKGPTWFSNFMPVMSRFRTEPGWVIGLILKTLLGWFIMTMLLSVGAPFWQDVLESLFGLKNKLRKQTDMKNVENESGAGQTKP